MIVVPQSGGVGTQMGSSAYAGAPGQTATHPQQAMMAGRGMYSTGSVNSMSVSPNAYYDAPARFRAMHGAADFSPENDVFPSKAHAAAASAAGMRFARQFPQGFGGPGAMGFGRPGMEGAAPGMGQGAPSDLMVEGSGAGMMPSAYSAAQRKAMAHAAAAERAHPAAAHAAHAKLAAKPAAHAK